MISEHSKTNILFDLSSQAVSYTHLQKYGWWISGRLVAATSTHSSVKPIPKLRRSYSKLLLFCLTSCFVHDWNVSPKCIIYNVFMVSVTFVALRQYQTAVIWDRDLKCLRLILKVTYILLLSYCNKCILEILFLPLIHILKEIDILSY